MHLDHEKDKQRVKEYILKGKELLNLTWMLTAVFKTSTNSKTIHSKFHHFSVAFQHWDHFQDFPGLENSTVKYKDFAGWLAILYSEFSFSTSVIYNPFKFIASSINAATSRQLCLTECIVDIGSKVFDCVFHQQFLDKTMRYSSNSKIFYYIILH